MIVVLLTWQAAPARGDEGAAALEWSVPEACGTQDGFLTRLAALLGRPKSSLAREITTVSIDIAQRGEEWQLHVRRKQDGALIERDLAGRDCVALVEAAAIIVALWIDPRRAMPTSPPPDETRPGPAADPAPDPAVSLDQPMAPSNDFRETEPSSPSLGISAGVAGSAGTLPHPSIGARLSGWIERGSFRLELAVAWHPPVEGRLADHPNSGADIELAAAALLGCVGSPLITLRVDACAVFEAGAMAARGRGVRDATTQVAPWLGAGVAGFVSWVTAGGPVIRLGVAGVVPLHRPSFAIDGAGSFFRASAIAGRAELILGWHFP